MFQKIYKIKSNLFTILKFAFGWPLSAVALIFVGRIIISNGTTVFSKLTELNLLLLFSGIICFLLYYFIRTYIWKILLKSQGYNIPQRKASFLWEISELKRFIPGNIWSYLGRATLFSDIGIPLKIVAKSLIIETESFLLGCFIISALLIFIYPKTIPFNITSIFLVLLLILLIFLTGLFINHSLFTKYIKGKFFLKLIVFFPNSSPKFNTIILLNSLLYLFFFGFGTYFTITSLTFISPEHFLRLSMFFVVSLLIGYLSFVTPMGLGVRESVMIFGLSHFISINTAGIMSIFARIILIFSELLFLIISYLWNRNRL